MTKFTVGLETLYCETGNPLYVWAALADYRACPDGAPLPAWIMTYLREAAMALEMMADAEQPGEAAKKANAALRLTGPGRNAFAEYRMIAHADAAAHVYENRGELWKKPAVGEQSKEWLAQTMGVGTTRTIGDWIKRIRQLRAAAKGK